MRIRRIREHEDQRYLPGSSAWFELVGRWHPRTTWHRGYFPGRVRHDLVRVWNAVSSIPERADVSIVVDEK